MTDKIKAEDIEIGTFLTKNDGLLTMGLMIQTIEPVDLKQRILSNQKIVEKLKDEIQKLILNPYRQNSMFAYQQKLEELQSILQAGEKMK